MHRKNITKVAVLSSNDKLLLSNTITITSHPSFLNWSSSAS